MTYPGIKTGAVLIEKIAPVLALCEIVLYRVHQYADENDFTKYTLRFSAPTQLDDLSSS